MSQTRPKIQRRPVHGVLLLDKPSGLSSNHALQAAKRLLRAEKAGHTGTLDPLATGLLPLCFGEATKFSQTLLDADKGYEATLKLGQRTDTFDAEGSVIDEQPVDVSRAQLENAIGQFVGEIEQIPPMHSALKHQGKPLYDYARRGEVIERAARRVTLHAIVLLDFDGINARIHVDCTKGTYIRSLADDIGRVLGCGAHLTALRRTRIGAFDLGGAVSLERFERMTEAERDAALAPTDALLAALPRVDLDETQAQRILHGQPIAWAQAGQGATRLYFGEQFLGLGDRAGALLKPQRLIRETGPTA